MHPSRVAFHPCPSAWACSSSASANTSEYVQPKVLVFRLSSRLKSCPALVLCHDGQDALGGPRQATQPLQHKHHQLQQLISAVWGRVWRAGLSAICPDISTAHRSRCRSPVFASISLPGFPAGREPVCPLAAGQTVHDGRYRLVQQAAELRYSWLWLAEALPGPQQSNQPGQQGDYSKMSTPDIPPLVLLKVSKDPDVEGYDAGCRERDMTLTAQRWGPPPSTSNTLLDKGTIQQLHWPPDVQAAASAPPDAPVVPCLDWFTLPGNPAGSHSCLVLKLLGDSLEVAAARYGQGLLAALKQAGAGQQAGSSGLSVSADELPTGLGLPLPVVKRLTRQLLRAIDHVHRQGLVHRAIYPEHLVLEGPFTPLGLEPLPARNSSSSNPTQDPVKHLVTAVQSMLSSLFGGAGGQQTQGQPQGNVHDTKHTSSSPAQVAVSEDNLGRTPLYLIDFGSARPAATASVPLPGDEPLVVGGHPALRPPEELLGGGVSPAYDMWQAGCLVWWLATGCHLFNDSYQQSDDMLDLQGADHQEAAALSLLEQHLAAMVCNFGPFPLQMVERCGLRGVYFRRSGHLRLEADYRLERDPLGAVLQREYGWDRQQAQDLESFLVPLFRLDPEQRASAGEMLNHPWLAHRQRNTTQRRLRGRKQAYVQEAASDSEAYDSEAAEAALRSILPKGGPEESPGKPGQ